MSDFWMILVFKPLFAIVLIYLFFYLPAKFVYHANRRMKDGLIKTIFFTNMASWGSRVDVGREPPEPTKALEDTFKNPSV